MELSPFKVKKVSVQGQMSGTTQSADEYEETGNLGQAGSRKT